MKAADHLSWSRGVPVVTQPYSNKRRSCKRQGKWIIDANAASPMEQNLVDRYREPASVQPFGCQSTVANTAIHSSRPAHVTIPAALRLRSRIISCKKEAFQALCVTKNMAWDSLTFSADEMNH